MYNPVIEVNNLFIKSGVFLLTAVDKRPILESSRTTYFDNLQDHRNESGKPSGALKIMEVPELPENERAKAHENED